MGVSVLGAFKLDHLQPVKLILSQNVPPSGREEGRKQQGEIMGKWVYDPEAFTLDHSPPIKLILFQTIPSFFPSIP